MSSTQQTPNAPDQKANYVEEEAKQRQSHVAMGCLWQRPTQPSGCFAYASSERA